MADVAVPMERRLAGESLVYACRISSRCQQRDRWSGDLQAKASSTPVCLAAAARCAGRDRRQTVSSQSSTATSSTASSRRCFTGVVIQCSRWHTHTLARHSVVYWYRQ